MIVTNSELQWLMIVMKYVLQSVIKQLNKKWEIA